ncbi:MAG: trimeric autotransporter adhesin, partial [Candidatus Poribacteria bacterium]|nr:trimeric autotransporter adhesin [Candidatus Poribacteria bacterium]
SSTSNQPLESIYFSKPKPGEVVMNKGWAAGSGGVVVHTDNAGTVWTKQNSKISDPLYGVYFDSDTRGWAVGKSGTILTTTDSGVTWNQSASAAAQGKTLYDIAFLNAANGVAVGSGGKIIFTTDGKNWEAMESNTTKVLWGVSFINANEGWAVGDLGTILYIKKL